MVRFALLLQTKRAVAALSAVVLAASLAFPQGLRAGHTIANGDCWKAGTPLWCRTTWTATRPIIDLSLYNQFSDIRDNWRPQAEGACNRWHDYTPSGGPGGDIWCHWAPTAGQSAVYLKTTTSSSAPLGVTWNCPTSGPCSAQAVAMNVWYSEIYFRVALMDGLSSTNRQWAFAHELGHALGLFHHANVLMHTSPNGITGPTATDYGVKPPCGGALGTGGARCVFKITR